MENNKVEAIEEMKDATTKRIEILKAKVCDDVRDITDRSYKRGYRTGFEDGRKAMYKELTDAKVFEEDEVSKRISECMDWADEVDKKFEDGSITFSFIVDEE